jgi:hypothetical protein
MSALLYANEKGMKDVVKKLIQLGKTGIPQHILSVHSTDEVIDYNRQIQHQILEDVNSNSSCGYSLLHVAISKG